MEKVVLSQEAEVSFSQHDGSAANSHLRQRKECKYSKLMPIVVADCLDTGAVEGNYQSTSYQISLDRGNRSLRFYREYL